MKATRRSRGICAGEMLKSHHMLVGGNLPFLKKMGRAMKGEGLWRGWDGDDAEIETDFNGLAMKRRDIVLDLR
jgi:hypothetical protein